MSKVLAFPSASAPAQPAARSVWWGIKYKQLGDIEGLDAIMRAVVLIHLGTDVHLRDDPDEGSPYAAHPRPSKHDIGAIVRVYDIYAVTEAALTYAATVHIRPDFKWIEDRVNTILNGGHLDPELEPERYKGLAMVFNKHHHPSPKFRDVFDMRASGNLFD